MGRRSKGDRVLLGSRASRRLHEAVRREADQQGLSVSDFIATILAHELHMPEEAPTPAGRQDPELPLTG